MNGLFYSTIAINALQYPAIQASIADVTSLKQRLSGYTEIRVMANAGADIGPIIGAILSVYGFQYIFLMAGIAILLMSAIQYYSGILTDRIGRRVFLILIPINNMTGSL